jgi:hypothetical protein
MSVLRKLRGMLGMAVVWGIAWAPLGALWMLIEWADAQLGVGREFLVPMPPLAAPMIMCGSWGFIAGAIFSLVLAAAERRRGGLAGLSLERTAAWGALGGLVLPATILMGPASLNYPWLFAALSVLFGAGSAAGGVALARRETPLLDVPEALALDAGEV